MQETEESKDRFIWRDLVAYWILGLCNNYGYVVMLSAAHDIVGQFNKEHISTTEKQDIGEGRECHILSTGTILLADVLPSLFTKALMPFVPFWVNTRIIVAIIASAAGFILVGFAQAEWVAILGVVVTSSSRGIGEATFLSYSSYFNKNVVSTWSSGTGGAGVIGSVSYASLKALKLGPRDTMLIMLIFPTIESLSFWLILRKPNPDQNMDVVNTSPSAEDDKPFDTFKEKIFYIKELLVYILPLFLVYFFEYFINMGLFELIHFRNIFIDKPSQYRWLQVDYQIGVFISRSSVNVIEIRRTWILGILQGINMLYFLTEVIGVYTPTIWIVFMVVLYEGLLGGGAYVNTFYRMSKDIPPERRKYAMAVVVTSDAAGITLAGILAIPVHNAICGLSAPERKIVW